MKRIIPALLFSLLSLLSLLLLPSGPAPAAPKQALITTVQVPRGLVVRGAILSDVNGDGKRDLLIASQNYFKNYDRRLRVHLRRDAAVCFGSEPAAEIAFDPGDVAFAAADVASAAGEEILFMGAREVFAGPVAGAGEKPPESILLAELLWQLPHPREIYTYTDAVADLNNDGLPDLVLPGPNGYSVAMQTRAEDGTRGFGRVMNLSLPGASDQVVAASRSGQRMQARERFRKLELSISLGGAEKLGNQSLISVAEAVPYPVLEDYDADGRTDILALSGDELSVWPQSGSGTFNSVPAVRLRFPVTVDQGRRLDLSFGTHAGDLDGDGRVDCVVFAGDRRSRDIRTQILVYRQTRGALFAAKGRPDQVLLVKGFAGKGALVDVDGDGDLDLTFRTFDLDAIDTVRAATGGGKLAVSLRVHLNNQGRFSKQPDLAMDLDVPAKGLRDTEKRNLGQFIGDITGDGHPDLLLRNDPTTVRIHAVRRTSRGLMVRSDPYFEMRVTKRADVLVAKGDRGPELLILENAEVHHVRFAR